MLFSIIIPVYNTEKYLGSCLDSIAAQAFDDFEAILVDDGSTDSSGRMCDEFCKSFNARAGRKARVKVIHQENRGASAARNRGIREATSEWLWFVDSDDFIAPDALNTIHERMLFAKGDLYAFQYIKTNEDGENPEYIFFRENQELVHIKSQGDLIWNYTDRLFCYKDGWEAPTRLYNRKIIDEYSLRFTDSTHDFAEDLCFLTEYMMCIKTSILLVNYLYFYRQRKSSIMRSLDQKTVLPRLALLLEDVLKEAKRFKKKQVIKEFDRICFALLKNHIQFKLDELTDEEICAEIHMCEANKTVGKYIKRVSKELMQEAKGDRRRKM